MDLDSPNWDEVAIIGEEGHRVFIAEINKDNKQEFIMRGELKEFLQLLNE